MAGKVRTPHLHHLRQTSSPTQSTCRSPVGAAHTLWVCEHEQNIILQEKKVNSVLLKTSWSFPGDHVTHLENVSEEEMNRLLGIVLDVEYLYTCVHKEEDADTKQVYFSLFKVISCCYCHLFYR